MFNTASFNDFGQFGSAYRFSLNNETRREWCTFYSPVTFTEGVDLSGSNCLLN